MSPKAQNIDDTAAEWAARVDRAPLKPQDAQALDVWLAADPRHAGAYARARAVASYFDKAKALGPDFSPEEFAPSAPTRRLAWRWAVAGVGGAIAAAAVFGVSWNALRQSTAGSAYSTALGEVRRVPLPDGSAATLNTNSEILVRFTEARRSIQLVKGEALFDVAKDASRPFIVSTDETRVRAVGTHFSVRRWGADVVEVVVGEGRVRFERGEGLQEEAASLGAETSGYASPGAPIRTASVSPEELNSKLAWREGRILFRGETLAQAAAEFARYSDRHIIIDDPAVAKQTVVGLFVANDPVNFAHAVATSFKLEAQETPDGVRLTMPKQEKGGPT